LAEGVPLSGRTAIYLAWNMSSHLDVLKSSVEKLLSYFHEHDISIKDMRDSIVCVEVYTGEESINFKDFDSDSVTARVEESFKYLNDKLGYFGYILLGVSNSPAGTCALEGVMDYCNGLIPLIKSNCYETVICIHHYDFLGFTRNAEPDAVSGVTQFLVSSKDIPVQTWAEQRQANRPAHMDSHHVKKYHNLQAFLPFSFITGIYMLLAAASVVVYVWQVGYN